MKLEYRLNDSQKFWEASLASNAITIKSGKIGTAGKTNNKKFSQDKNALAEYRKLVSEKLACGYRPTAKTAYELLDKIGVVTEPKAISSVYVGHIIPFQMITDICVWMTACIHFGMDPEEFAGVWERFLYGDEKFAEPLGQTPVSVTGRDSQYWSDNLEMEDNPIDLYTEAVKSGGDRFIWYGQNGECDFNIVALRGDPGAQAIYACVYETTELKKWPKELGPNAPIASMTTDNAILRDGRMISLYE